MQRYTNIEFEYLALWPKTDMYRMSNFYTGGVSNSHNASSSQNSGGGTSTSQSYSATNLTPQQLLQLYGNSLPGMAKTVNTATGNTMAAPALNAASNGAVQGVNAINLNGLSPGESNAVERANNQGLATSGNLGLNNPTNTISNAVNFGGAFNSKIPLMNAAVNSASGAGTANSNALGTTASMFNPLANNANSLKSTGTSSSQYGSQGTSNASGGSDSMNGGIGCFLTTACCNHRGLPDNCDELTTLRRFRDSYVPKDLVKRYYSIAPNICMRIEGDQTTLNYVYSVVQKCVSDIKKGRNKSALRTYKLMVHKLEMN